MNFSDQIRQLAEGEGIEFRSDYSGRFMYGRTCVGVVADEPSLIEFAGRFAMEFGETLPAPATDHLGLSTIWYWPKAG